MPAIPPRLSASLAATALLALAACGEKPANPPPPPPPEVGVVTVQPRSVPLASELPGRIEAVRTAPSLRWSWAMWEATSRCFPRATVLP